MVIGGDGERTGCGERHEKRTDKSPPVRPAAGPGHEPRPAGIAGRRRR